MKKLPDLKQLSDEAKNALIVERWQEIQKLRAALDTLRIKTQLISRQNQLEFKHSTIMHDSSATSSLSHRKQKELKDKTA
ncbi:MULTISPECIES: hypothetical protein [unclassified Microcoleus]|uniref:hypothetical protein n=1 Tax=unclassified Microcoleus TaxID=2642155 RepID=UPI002FD4AA3F